MYIIYVLLILISLPILFPYQFSRLLYCQFSQGAEWFKAKVDIEVSKASQTAIQAVEKQGGRVITAHYNRLGLRVLLKPEKFEDRPLPRRALPNKKLMAYYLNPKNRFVLSPGLPCFWFVSTLVCGKQKSGGGLGSISRNGLLKLVL